MRNIPLALLVPWLIGGMFLAVDRNSEKPERLIASVSGKNISYFDIKATPEQLDRAFEQRYGRPPADGDREKIYSLRLETEASRLERVIRQKIRDAELTRLGVIPTDAEIEARCDREYPPDKRRNMGEEFRNATRIILRAYERVLLDGDAPDDVYSELLRDQMTIEQWKLRVKHDVSEKSIQNLRAVLDRPAEELFNCKALMHQLITIERKDAILDQEIAKSDPEYAEYLRLVAEEPRSPILQEKGPRYREARRYQWWQKRFADADVVILDPKYNAVLDSIRHGQ